MREVVKKKSGGGSPGPAAVVRLSAWVVVASAASGMDDANVGADSPSVPRCDSTGDWRGWLRPAARERALECGKARRCG